ncbi:ATP-dependent Clp protease proteolytic subunit [Acidovorax sp. sic0104]|uniref:ATP-dependent Clp protease proteolytic subunit n=1 Tax=Acidovorax sp. sic0104 TaxID=2854784 RepID=UPI001C480603|nr:ATP-dependent Clp protease proteolytic subunit [Acidovorax sp. sic0104]MBV7541916.1 ATP-dependent Clp protease proteolytic subunit [Acidovorax sp. sic0104]
MPTKIPSLSPDIRLFGDVNENMLSEFFRQQAEANKDGPIVFELSTSGGDAEVGRRIAEELRLWQMGGARIYFLGKTYVYSAGVTIMSAIPKGQRFLTEDCELLIHERKMTATVSLDGALRSCRAKVNDVLAQIESGQRLQSEGFARLAEGSALTAEEIERRVLDKDWYLTAKEALEHGLVASVI